MSGRGASTFVRYFPASEYETANRWGVVVPRGTPPAIMSRLNDEIKAVFIIPDVEKRLVNEGAELAIKTPAELQQYVAAEIEKWVKVARGAGVRGE
jgi:tripartite-type tricarboxylate transporter receptor subunit TctC